MTKKEEKAKFKKAKRTIIDRFHIVHDSLHLMFFYQNKDNVLGVRVLGSWIQVIHHDYSDYTYAQMDSLIGTASE